MRRLSEGHDALARGTSQDIEAARALFANVIEDITDADAAASPELAKLRADARELEQRTLEVVKRQDRLARSRERASEFLALRDQAFFELYRDSMAGLPASRTPRSRELARRALAVFPDTDDLPFDEGHGLERARAEVLFLLAEGTASAPAERRHGARRWHCSIR